MPEISLFPNIKVTMNPENVTLEEFYRRITEGHYSEAVLKYRATMSKEDKDKLPYSTISCTCNPRKEAGVILHSGRIAIDLDPKENPGILTHRSLLCDDPYTEALFNSCSGKGICIVVKIQPDKHSECFEFLQEYYKNTYGLIIDPACRDISRARYVSYDKDLFLNQNSQTCEPLQVEDYDRQWIEVVVERVKLAQTDISPDYETWRNIGFALADGLQEDGRDYYHEISQFYDDYSIAATDKQYDECLKSRKTGITIASLFHYCREAGVNIAKPNYIPETEDSKAMREVYKIAYERNRDGQKMEEVEIKNIATRLLIDPSRIRKVVEKVYTENEEEFGIEDAETIRKVEVYLNKKYKFYKNVVNDSLEFKPAKAKSGRLFPAVLDEIYIELKKAHFKISLGDVQSLLNTAGMVTEYDPIKRYFENLPKWDGVDHITKLAGYIKTADQDFFNEQFKKALVRSIACSLTDYINRICFVLIGRAQETGKSTFLRFLCPPDLRDYYTDMDMDESKDTSFRLSDNFIYNLEELSSLSKLKSDRLKALISSGDVKGRRAFRRDEKKSKRRCSFWGSTNNEQFLTDETGNTRWLCFSVLGINHDYSNSLTGKQEVDIDKVWAQAYHLFKTGYAFGLNERERLKRDLENKEHEVTTNEEELLNSYFKRAKSGETGSECLTVSDIQAELASKVNGKIVIKQGLVVKALNNSEFTKERIRRNGVKLTGYWVERVTDLNSKTEYEKEGLPNADSDELPF